MNEWQSAGALAVSVLGAYALLRSWRLAVSLIRGAL